MYLNQSDPVMKNKNIRKAVALGFNRDELATKIVDAGSKPAYWLVPPGIKGPNGKTFREAQGNVVRSDAKKAQKYWERGVKELGKDPSLTMVTEDDSKSKKISEYIQGQLKQGPSIHVHIKQKPFKAFIKSASKHNYQIGSGSGWESSIDDPIEYLRIFTSGSSQNFVDYKNKNFDRLIQRSKKEKDETKRMHLLMRAERMLLVDDVVVAPQYVRGVAMATKAHVKKWVMNKSVDIGNYKYWRLG